ncbi:MULTISPECIES: vitamin K epoxide reductase family protein [Flavobacterium]|uniref:Vitamin K epoxide reductase domain-containing protein n=1 Tax=Flavobacterium hankyongi TaxID=1176532 RepID=A0ABP9A5N0_9FLAO|nr:vitamin K epoxide reductase family protein [Flavobacterium sp. N1846]
MIKVFSFLFHFLKKENIEIDETEFLFQMQSHPDFPSLLTISDTLSFFNIENTAIRIDFQEIELLPNNFIASLKEEDNRPRLCAVEKKDNFYLLLWDNEVLSVSKEELQKRWTDIVLIISDSKSERNQPLKKDFSFFLIYVLCFILLIQFKIDIVAKFFFIFPLLGVFLSIAALKDLFGVENNLINNLCNITSSSNCSEVVNSSKWKIFRYINFSDLSIVFFVSQMTAYFIFCFALSLADFFSIQFFLLTGSFPIIIISLFYQKFVEKKWCPICVMLISILSLEFFYLLRFEIFSLSVSFQSIFFYIALVSMIIFLWKIIKKQLIDVKELKEFRLKSNRFQRNYEIFKNTLVSKEKKLLPESPIVFGNKESKTQIAIITHPFCKFCEEAHEILEQILLKYHDHIQIQVIFKVDFENSDEKAKLFFKKLLGIYFSKGKQEFRKAIKYWYKFKSIEKWTSESLIVEDFDKMDDLLIKQNEWCSVNNVNYTPAIFVNGYEYPKLYERENLEFFINELIEDSSF